MSYKKRRSKKKNKELIFLIILLLIVFVCFSFKKIFNSEILDKVKNSITNEDKNLNIIDLKSTTRPVGVVIDNVSGAMPQAGLNDAYLVYEIIVEGGYTRLFAFFKDVNTTMIGPVRSLRHYFIDYALENDAVIAHYGWSPKAQSDVENLNIKNLNGLNNPGNMYYRDSSLTKAPHNAFTTMSNIRDQIDNLNYDKKVKDTVLKYSFEEVNLNGKDGSISANNITIKYSNNQITSYEYDSEAKVYKRSNNGKKQIDRNDNNQLTAKNIIVYNVKNYPLVDIEDKDRQELDNIGIGDGYYITNGYAIPITYEKNNRSSKTKYKYLNGSEIKVNDGITYIQIQPSSQKVVIN